MNLMRKHWEKILILVISLPLVYGAYLYLANNNLAVYDAPGHINLIWYLKEYLWPNFTGWNSFNLLGLDQGRFYPPLFHYLAATLSFIWGIETATKLVIISSLISLPLGIYYFLSALFKDTRERVLVSGIVLLILAVLPGYLGANIKGLFQVGLLPSFVSTPILFFYLGSLLRIRKIGWFIPSLLLVALILTHIVAALVAVVFLLATILTQKIYQKPVKIYGTHLVVALSLTTFFWLPFLFQSQQLSTSVHLSSLGIINAVVLIISLGFVVYLFKKNNLILLSIALVTLLLSGLTTFDYFTLKLLSGGFIYEKIYNLHLYRLQIYEFVLFAVLVSYYPITWLYSTVGKVKSRLYFIALIPTITLLLIFVLRGPVLVDKVKMTNLNSEQLSGRFLETFSRSESAPFIYTEQSNLIINKNLPWAYSLFTDANQNGPFLSSLIRSLSPEDYPKAKTKFIEESEIDKERLRDVVNLFAINNLLQTNYFVDKRSDGLDLISSDSFKQNLVEVTNLKVKVINQNWDKAVQNWWLEKGHLTYLLVNNKEEDLVVNDNNQGSKTIVEIAEHNKTWTNFTLDVKSSQKQPVLVKFSYSPNWQAYQNSQIVKIYQTSPSLMMVFGSGKIDFKYQFLWYQYLAGLISGLTIFGLGVYYLRQRTKL